MMNKQRAGYTKMGFSKPFACCGYYNYCEMGKGTCFYAESDPETMENCLAYRRQQRLLKSSQTYKETDSGQLSLF